MTGLAEFARGLARLLDLLAAHLEADARALPAPARQAPAEAVAGAPTGADYLERRDLLDQWAAYYAAQNDAAGMAEVWRSRQELAAWWSAWREWEAARA